jgi:hypothetical protein
MKALKRLRHEIDSTTADNYYLTLALTLERNLPPQVWLSKPITVYDALDGYSPFHIEWIPDATVSMRLVI